MRACIKSRGLHPTFHRAWSHPSELKSKGVEGKCGLRRQSSGELEKVGFGSKGGLRAQWGSLGPIESPSSMALVRKNAKIGHETIGDVCSFLNPLYGNLFK